MIKERGYLDGGYDEAQYDLAGVGLLHLELTPQGLEDPVHHPLHLDISTQTFIHKGATLCSSLNKIRFESVCTSTHVFVRLRVFMCRSICVRGCVCL